MTFSCFMLSVTTAFVLNVEFEGGLISGVVVFSVFSLAYSLMFGLILFVYKSVRARKNT